MTPLPSQVKICECWARDGIQGEAAFIPTETKVDMINRMTRLGFKRVEATSFSHPKLVQQFADSTDVLKKIHRPPDVQFIAIVPNEKALDRVLECCQGGYGVQEITAIISASEDHLLANLERTMDETKTAVARIVSRARGGGLKVIGCIGTAFGCPLAGDVPLSDVADLTDWYLDLGADYIMLGDTTGEANPRQVRDVYARMLDRFPGVDFIAHFHDTRGMGIANTLAALEAGVAYHDSSLGGVGGQPATKRPKYHEGLTGNTATEDLVLLMHESGVETGVDLSDVIELTRRAEEACGRTLLGHTARSGPVRHRAKAFATPGVFQSGRSVPPSLILWGEDDRDPIPDGDGLVQRIVRHALEKNWPLPEGLSVDSRAVSLLDHPASRDVLLTRFEVREAGPTPVLEALCQRSNGDVLFQGPVTLVFEPAGSGTGGARHER